MPFKTPEEKDSNYSVKTHLIKDNEYIVSVYHGNTAVEAVLVSGINNSLVETRKKAEQYNCNYTFAQFPEK